jgi:tetratricopeptide (TPR) repeat protein
VSFAGNKVQNADVEASSSLKIAKTLAPNRPEVPYLRAVLAYHLGRYEEAAYYVGEALQLKPDYRPAQALEATLKAK